MTTTAHKLATIANNHGIVGLGPYASAAARRAAVLTSADVGKVAQQTDTDPATYWIVLKVVSGVGTWSRCDTGAEVVTPPGPLTIMAGHVRFGFSGDSGLSTTGWIDQGPNGRNVTGTCAIAAAALGGKNCMQTNGSSHSLTATFATPAPATTPTYFYVIARNDVGGGFGNVVSLEAANGLAIVKDGVTEICTVTPGFGIRHVTGWTVGSFKRLRALFSGSASDVAQVGTNTAVSAAPASNTAGTGLFIGFSNGGYGASTYAELWAFDQDPGSTALAALDAWASSKYSTTFP